MIVVTLGTIPYPFNRVVKWLNLLLERGIISEPVFLQYGNSDVSILEGHPLVTLEPTISSDKLIKLVDESRFVISHAGQGSARMLSSRRVSFVLIPRLQRYGEHVDNHQLDFALGVDRMGIKVCLSLEDVEKAILQPPLPFEGKLFDGPRLTEHLLSRYPVKTVLREPNKLISP